jgi:hypothetical protein
MSQWIAITIQDLYDTKVAGLIDASNNASLGTNQKDRTTGIIADVTAEIRRKVARCNQLDVDTTKIPGGLKTLALDIMVCRIKTALEIELLDGERDLLRQRTSELNRIADGKDLVDPPDNPIAANMTQGIAQPAFGRSPHRRQNEVDG